MKKKMSGDEILAAIAEDVAHRDAMEEVAKMSPAELARELRDAGLDVERVKGERARAGAAAEAAAHEGVPLGGGGWARRGRDRARRLLVESPDAGPGDELLGASGSSGTPPKTDAGR